MDSKIVYIDYLAEEHSHLVEDDLFWYKYIINLNKEAHFYTSKYSKRQLPKEAANKRLETFSLWSPKSKNNRYHYVIRMIKIPSYVDSNIIIHSFEELSVIIFLLKNMFRNNKITLVVTNNISLGRFNLWYSVILKRIIYPLIFKYTDNIFCQSKYQKDILVQSLQGSHKKNAIRSIKITKHHLLGRKRYLPASKSSMEISFFGPINIAKSISSFLNLAKYDNSGKHVYNIYNPGKINVIPIQTFINKHSINYVHIINEYLSEAQFWKAIRGSKYIMLTHGNEYSGKLSGHLCDCISAAVPIISRRISPNRELAEKYGDIGYFYDNMADLKQILNNIDNEKNRERQRLNMIKINRDHRFDIIEHEYNQILFNSLYQNMAAGTVV
ncbi:MAG: hypothetical protein HQ507_03350 [Candidatus Marinimicrobia bacterium]|nr:hypothetical protein [Candidatus Neomarinimicrobiota bacterium]